MGKEEIITYESAKDILLHGVVCVDESTVVGRGRVEADHGFRQNECSYYPEIVPTNFGCEFVYQVLAEDGQETLKKRVEIGNSTLEDLANDTACMGSAMARTEDGVLVGMERNERGILFWAEIMDKRIKCQKSRYGVA